MKEHALKTYEAGILQARAYRNLRTFMQDHLEKYELTMMQWALLGTVAKAGTKGVTINQLATILDVEGSLITNMVNTAVKTGGVQKKIHPNDSRARIVIATTGGLKLVTQIETELRKAMRSWLTSIPRASLQGYLHTLEKIAQLK